MLLLTGLVSYGLLAIRIALGAIFLYHGVPKLKSPKELAGAAGLPMWFAFLIGLGETVSGLLSLIGFLTELAAIFLVVVMLGALYYKILKWKTPFSAYNQMGWEFDLILLAAALILFLGGAGSLSVDALIGLWP